MTTYSRSRSLRQRFWCLIRPEGPSRGRRGSISRNPAPCAVCIRHAVRRVRALGTVFCSGSAPLCRNLVELYGSFPHLAMALQICCSHKLPGISSRSASWLAHQCMMAKPACVRAIRALPTICRAAMVSNRWLVRPQMGLDGWTTEFKTAVGTAFAVHFAVCRRRIGLHQFEL